MMRNPWGETTYSGAWFKDDPNWTDELILALLYNI